MLKKIKHPILGAWLILLVHVQSTPISRPHTFETCIFHNPVMEITLMTIMLFAILPNLRVCLVIWTSRWSIYIIGGNIWGVYMVNYIWLGWLVYLLNLCIMFMCIWLYMLWMCLGWGLFLHVQGRVLICYVWDYWSFVSFNGGLWLWIYTMDVY